MTPKTIIVSVLGLAVIFWLYTRVTGYTIVSQKAYQASAATEKGTRGYPVGSSEKLRATLSKFGIAESDFEKEQGPVDFNAGFVFVVENGVLAKISRGNSGFDLAAVKPATNLSLAVVRGPRSRSIKVVGD